MEIEGKWSIGNKLVDVWGTLKFSFETGTSLNINFGTEDINGQSISDFLQAFTQTKIPIIMGKTIEGEFEVLPITLLDCTVENAEYFAGYTATALITAKYLLSGTVASTEDLQFHRFSVKVAHLDEWLNVSGITFDYSRKYDIIIKYKQPSEILLRDEPQISIIFDAQLPNYDFSQKEAKIIQEPYITIIPNGPFEINQYIQIIRLLQGFLTLATGTPAYILSVGAYSGSPDGKSEFRSELFFKDMRTEKIPVMLPIDMLFSYEDISENVKVPFSRWFERADLLQPVYELFHTTMFIPDLSSNTLFLDLVQALESYHRRVGRNNEFDDQFHKKRIDGIISAAPKEYTLWLKEKLEYSNEMSLRKRLSMLIAIAPKPIGRLIGDNRKFIDSVCNTRNYLTHYDKRLESKVVTGKALDEISAKLTVLLQSLLLLEIGISKESVEGICSSLLKRKRFGDSNGVTTYVG